MPATTSGGTPYAVPTDPVQQWPATSQSVALKVDEKVKKSGDTMTGTLTVATPTDPTHAATKGYVDRDSKFLRPAPSLDANWLLEPGNYYTQNQAINGLPDPQYWGFLLVFAGSASEALQVFIKADAPQLGFWVRSRHRDMTPGTWSPWHHIQPTP